MAKRNNLWRRWSMAAAVALVVYLSLDIGRGYPWQLALLSALAVGALAYSTLRTLERRFWSHRRWEIESPASRRQTDTSSHDDDETRDSHRSRAREGQRLQ